MKTIFDNKNLKNNLVVFLSLSVSTLTATHTYRSMKFKHVFVSSSNLVKITQKSTI